MEHSVTTRLSLHVPSLFQRVHQNPQPPPRRHERYYFTDGNVTFLVEGILYNIHQYLFQRYSSNAASILSHSHGRWDDSPIALTGVTSKDFDLFLSILYPADFGVFSATTVEEWSSILALAAKWNFQSIKDLATKQLFQIASPIDKIVLARKHDIVEWLPDAYSAICARQDALTLEEGIRLGMEDVIKIAAMRQGDSGPGFSPTHKAGALERTFGLTSTAVNSCPRPDATHSVETVESKPGGAVDTKLPPRSQQRENILGGNERWHEEEDSECDAETCDICGQKGQSDHLCPSCGLHNCVCPATKYEDEYCKLCGEEGLCRICPFCSRYDCVCGCAAGNRRDEFQDLARGTPARSRSAVCKSQSVMQSEPSFNERDERNVKETERSLRLRTGVFPFY